MSTKWMVPLFFVSSSPLASPSTTTSASAGTSRCIAVRHHMRYHGPIVGTTLYFLETRLGLEDPYDIHRMRHLAYFLIFLGGVYCFYRLAEGMWGWGIGLLGALLLAASPRIFADSFYNPKDVASPSSS